jgi:hypothetical protein
MATTTNYGWTTPDDTALVKDGAAAIRTLGSSVDTTTKALNPSTTLGDIEYRSSTANTNTRLGIGSTGQVLTVSGGVPSWATASSGGMTLISEQVASANSSISFSSIAGTYKQLLLIWSGIYHSGGGSAFSLRFNNDSTSNPYRGQSTGMVAATGYGAAGQQRDSIAMNAGGYTMYSFGEGTNFSSADLNVQVMGSILIDNYASTTKFKSFDAGYSYYLNGDNKYLGGTFRGMYNSTSAITSLDIVRVSGTDTISNSTNTSIRLYGLS